MTKSACAQLVTDSKQPSSKRVLRVVLVHGTFAPQAAWSRRNSPFAWKLKIRLEAFNQFKVDVYPFDWSGTNSMSARTQASRE